MVSPATTRRRWSLRLRLYVVAGVATMLAWIGGGAAMLAVAEHVSERMCRENLANLAQTILGFSEHELEEIRADSGGAVPDNVHRETAATLASRYSYQIWSDDGHLLLRSNNAPGDRRLAPPALDGFAKLSSAGGRELDVFALRLPEGRMSIVVADSEEEQLVKAAFGSTFGLAMGTLLLPMLGGTWLMLRRALAPLISASLELEQRSPQMLTPLAISNAPAELLPMIGAVNQLMLKVDDALSQERKFTALAAHELRTPLASLRVQAQVLARCSDPDERVAELRSLADNVDRCTHMLNQMLALAKLDAADPTGLSRQWLEVNTLVAEVLVDFANDASQRNIEVSCVLRETRLHADRIAMQTLLRNLLSNALHHTPPHGHVRIGTRAEAGVLVLTVEDSGPGIPVEDRQRVFARFYRRLGGWGQGVGLGLAIVENIARSHGARVTLGDADLGGLLASVYLPQPDQNRLNRAA